jgi:hypothetical protein
MEIAIIIVGTVLLLNTMEIAIIIVGTVQLVGTFLRRYFARQIRLQESPLSLKSSQPISEGFIRTPSEVPTSAPVVVKKKKEDDAIPAFLRLTQEERREAWKKPASADTGTVEGAVIRKPASELNQPPRQ